MLSKFWESIGSDLAERWLEYIFGPAFLFWAGGCGIYVWKTGCQFAGASPTRRQRRALSVQPPRVEFRSLGIGSLTIVDLSPRERIVLYLGLG